MHLLHYNCITTAFADCISLHMHSMHSAFFSLLGNAMAARPSLRARPRHAEDQPASDRGETAPPSAPARARSVNTYARPSPTHHHDSPPTAESAPRVRLLHGGRERRLFTPAAVTGASSHLLPQPAPLHTCCRNRRLFTPAAVTGASSHLLP